VTAFALTVTLLFSSCAKTFYSVDSKTLARKHHQSVAVMPSFVSIASTGLNKRVVEEALEKQAAEESLKYQQIIYAWMKESKSKGKIAVDIQDIETTNAILITAGYPETLITDAKLCELLGVDGILVSNFEITNELAFITLGVFLPVNEIRGTIAICDCANNKVIWSYQRKIEDENPRKIVEKFIKKAGKKMPYLK